MSTDAALPSPTSFEEFWPFYVSQHLDATCRRLHYAGTSLALGCALVSPLFPPALLAAPVFGYGFAWVGHYGFEKNRPATFGSIQHAMWSLRGDFRMLRLAIAGRMGPELVRGRAYYEQLAGTAGESAPA